LVSRHPDPTQYNPLFRDKPGQECFLFGVEGLFAVEFVGQSLVAGGAIGELPAAR